MKDYKEFLDLMNEKLNEAALQTKTIENIKRLYNSGNFKESLKNTELELGKLINDLKLITLDEIKLDIYNDVNKDIIQIDYMSKYQNRMNNIKDLLKDLNDSNILYKLFPEGETNFNIYIDITKKNFNQIDILESLPFCLKGIGLGKKIVEKIIKHYNYISLQSYTNPSNEITMVFHSLAKDSNYYTFVDESESILVFDKLDKDVIIPVVKDFLKNSDTYAVDDDFLKDFDLNEKDIIL